MWRFKFSAWAVVLMMTALSFGACDNDDDDTFVPPSNITEALKQVYPAAQNGEDGDERYRRNSLYFDCLFQGTQV